MNERELMRNRMIVSVLTLLGIFVLGVSIFFWCLFSSFAVVRNN